MRKILVILLTLVMVLSLTACNSQVLNAIRGIGDGSGDSEYYEGIGGDGKRIIKDGISASSIGAIGEGDPIYEGEGDEPIPTMTPIEPGQLTACAYFDNFNFDFWKTLITKGQTTQGAFYEYKDTAFKVSRRIKLSFPRVYYASATLVIDGEDVFTGVIDHSGDIYLFTDVAQDEYEVRVTYKYNETETATFTDTVTGDKTYGEGDLEPNTIDTNRSEMIDLMFVIDTTGSMGDEIDYLKAEIDDVIARVQETNPDVSINLALLFYRDVGDEYVTKYFDFTADIATQKQNLSLQSANGGGDFEEAVHTALSEAATKQWRTNATKIIVHVADAPAHDEDISAWNEATLTLAGKGIRIITVASSGIDKKTEYLFRCQSMLTGGVYTYLTNDSGIGGDHIEATVPGKITVEYLNSMLVRLIHGFQTGEFGEAVEYTQEQ